MSHPTLLRTALLADAAVTAVMGALLLALPNTLAAAFGLPAWLLVGAGTISLLAAAFAGALGRQAHPSPRLVRALIALGLLWIADSVLLLALGPALFDLRPTALGTAFVVGQALAVAGFSAAQAIGLRQAGAPRAVLA